MKFIILGWTCVLFQILCLFVQLFTGLNRLLVINIMFMCIALISFKLSNNALHAGSEIEDKE